MGVVGGCSTILQGANFSEVVQIGIKISIRHAATFKTESKAKYMVFLKIQQVDNRTVHQQGRSFYSMLQCLLKENLSLQSRIFQA